MFESLQSGLEIGKVKRHYRSKGKHFLKQESIIYFVIQ